MQGPQGGFTLETGCETPDARSVRWGLPGDCVHRAYSTGTVSGMWVTLGTVGVRYKMQCLGKRLTLQSVNACPNVYGLEGDHHGDCDM